MADLFRAVRLSCDSRSVLRHREGDLWSVAPGGDDPHRRDGTFEGRLRFISLTTCSAHVREVHDLLFGFCQVP
jgi:hypothetical protein